MKHTLKGWLVDNAVTVDNKEDKILLLESAGSLTLEDILSEMKKEDTGLRAETLEHSVKLYNRIVSDLVLSGYSVNTGLFRAVPQFRGVIDGGQWNPEKNSIYVSFTQDKDLREAITQTSVNILGEKRDAIYIIGGEDTSTRATDGIATAGRNYILTGRMLKVAGEDATVGITLTDSKGTVTKLAKDMLVVNNPTQLIILLPSDLADGDYTLTVTTQYSGSGTLLKRPRTTSKMITIGQSSAPDGGGSGDDGDQNENPLG